MPALLGRLLARIRTPPKGGGPGDYEGWALEVEGVTRAWESPNHFGLGTVALFFVLDNQAGTIIPNPAKIAEVQTYLDGKAPITVGGNAGHVYAMAPTESPINPTISVTPDTTAIRAAVEAELEDMLYREAEPGGTIYLSQIREAISLAEDEQYHTLTLPAADHAAPAGYLPTLGTVTWA